ncbi:MAG: sigma 54-interacting transcriptional regulator [Candidatus Krumholzibacteria bacterium]|nr:sigma 54-interacting transcriptional regulator [Candidatus Krumholzibacteria bacterium]
MKKDRKDQAGGKVVKPGKAEEIFAGVEADLQEIEKSESVLKGINLSARLEKTEHKLNKLEMLIDITRSLNSTLNLNELLEKIIDSTIKLTDTDRGFLMLSDRKGDLKFRIARDRNEKSLEEKDFTVSYSIINDVSMKGKPLFISDALENSRFKDQKSVLDLQLRTAVCVPLILEDSVIGVIYTGSNRLSNEFTKDDISIVSAFAVQAAIATENARLHGELILSRENLTRENLELKQELFEKYEFSGIIGKSKAMQDIFSTIRKIASLSTTILIQGETGTGKELIARAIHFNGNRKDKHLVTINCGAMPGELLESELFGHRKGSFTGATSDKTGLFEKANGGTIFLDEIGDMPQALQVKLLRAIQEGEIRRVGDVEPRDVDVRVIAATNRDLTKDIMEGRFRHDLYYRLNVVPITIPPLRERKEDILPLIEHFLEKHSKKMEKENIRIAAGAIKLLLSNPWPGNVRELENVIERALALCGDSTILSNEHFPQLESQAGIFDQLEQKRSLKEKLRTVEKKIIIETLEKTGWKVTRAAGLLDVSRQHLHNKIKQYNIYGH